MDRRLFLRRLALGSAGLVLGEEAMEAFARLTHRRTLFPSAEIYPQGLIDATTSHSVHGLDRSFYEIWRKVQGPLAASLAGVTPEFESFDEYLLPQEWSGESYTTKPLVAPPLKTFTFPLELVTR